MRGLRRGEAAGLRWSDLDLGSRTIVVERQLTCIDGQIVVSPPKSAASRRTLALDKTTVRLLRRHEHGQDAERNLAAERWHETGYVFTRANGLPLRPDYLTHRFATLVAGAELPPIRLHDLRHGAATLALAAHTDLKVIQAMLGHSSIVLTCDTYTSVLPDIAFEAAEKTARLVLNAARKLPK